MRPLLAASDATSGAELYRNTCLSCHGEDGAEVELGDRGLRNLADADAEAFVVAVAFGEGTMPGFGDSLRAQDHADLVAYARTLDRE